MCAPADAQRDFPPRHVAATLHRPGRTPRVRPVDRPLGHCRFRRGRAGSQGRGQCQKDIKKADSYDALDIPFEQAWDLSFTALLALDIEIVKSARTPAQDGGVIEARLKKFKIKVVVAEINDKITEVGIWVKKDKALAEFLSRKISEICCSMRPVG